MVGKVAPHEGKELEYVSLGIKPLASLEFSKDPKQYTKALKLLNVLSVYKQTDDLITITRKENASLHGVFKVLTSHKAHLLVRSEQEKHRLLGRLFGYSEEDIDAFIKSDLKCACGQCKFGE